MKTSSSIKRYVLTTMCACLLGTLLGAAEEKYEVHLSTTPHHLRNKKHPMTNLRAVGEKMLTPNPQIQSPRSNPMPVNPPQLPTLTPLVTIPKPTPTQSFFGAVAKVMTTSWDNNIFVWLPALSTDPNTGPTFGILPVLVLADKATHQIRHLVAPSYTYNEIFGQTGTMRYYLYPKQSSQLFVLGSYSQKTNREIKVRYEDAAFLGGRAFIRAEGGKDTDGSPRFYGLGPETHAGDEAGYVSHESSARFAMGVNFARAWRASVGLRYLRMSTDPNIVPGVRDLAESFPTILGLASQNTVGYEFRLLWDTRDYPVTPSRGSSGELFVARADPALDSDSNYVRYGLEGKRFFLWNDPRQVTVIHGLYEWVNGPNIPFYELSSLGGRDSLRGFGEGRYTDRGRVIFNIEQRYALTELSLMGVTTKFEVAPFFDLGAVFPTLPEIRRQSFLPVYGVGFRAAVKPNVVGSVDLGIGKEGPAVFVGIDYPF